MCSLRKKECELYPVAVLTTITLFDCKPKSGYTYRVVLGEHDIYSNGGTEQIIAVNQVYIHSGWNSGNVAGG